MMALDGAGGKRAPHEPADDRAPPTSGGLYGTVLVLAVILALSKSGPAEASVILGGVLVTAGVFWVVHIYADTLAARVREPGRGWGELARHFGRHELPIVQSALPPAIPLALGAAGVLSHEAASWAAIGVGLAGLFGWGVLLGRALGYRKLGALTIGLLNVLFGAFMVGLKVLVH